MEVVHRVGIEHRIKARGVVRPLHQLLKKIGELPCADFCVVEGQLL